MFVEMKEAHTLKLACAFALLVVCSAPAFGQAAGVARLRDVKSVYVAEMGKSAWAKAIRQELIGELAKRFKVVDAPAEADAVLDAAEREGTQNVDRQYQSLEHDMEARTGSQVVNSRRLVFSLRSKQSRALWSLKLDPANYRGSSEAQRGRALAARVGGEMLKAFDKDTKRHG